MKVLFVANPRPTHVGRHLHAAANTAGMATAMKDVVAAYEAPRWLKVLYWRLLGRRPFRLQAFSDDVVRTAASMQPDVVLCTGVTPLSKQALQALRSQGVRVVGFLTDDPWNPAHRAPWFLQALPHYDHLFTPRRANMVELEALHGPTVSYLPFAYEPAIHHRAAITDEERARWHSEVLFIGGADPDREPVMERLASEGFKLGLWGGYWSTIKPLSTYARGHASSEQFAKLVAAADSNLCLVRKANRDGHSMRTFELAACGATMLVEDTAEQRDFFGPDLERVAYFQDRDSLVRQTRALMATPQLRTLLSYRVHHWATNGGHTYADRLNAMLGSE